MISQWLDRLIFCGLLLAVCLSPWLFGSVENHAIDALGILLILLFLLWGIKCLIDGEVRLWVTPVHLCLLLFLGVVLLQMAPLLWSVRPLPVNLPDARSTLGLHRWNRITLDREATARAATKLAILIGYFFIAAQFLRTRFRLNFLINALVLTGFTLALVGILNRLTFNGKILWFRPTDFASDAFGPFVNRNHFAGFMELLIPLPLAMILARGIDRERWIFYGFCGVLMATALVYSLSRGGLLSLSAEFLLLPILAEPELRRRRRMKEWEAQSIGQLSAGAVAEDMLDALPPTAPQGAPAAAFERGKSGPSLRERLVSRPAWVAPLVTIFLVSSTVALGVAWIGSEPLMSRLRSAGAEVLQGEAPRQSRPEIWRTALSVFRHYPVLGAGLGAFPRAYTMFDRSPGAYSVSEAHNDYLQVLADTGVVGGIIGCWFLYLFVRLAGRALRQPEGIERGATLGATVGVCGIFVHSLVDFNLQITSNALLFLTLVALLASSELRSRQLVMELKRLSRDAPAFDLG